MPVPENLKDATRAEWRELGFYYTQDDQPRSAWRIVGSPAGLANFGAMLVDYVSRPSNAELSEHEHWGPYSYLKVMTSKAAGIDAESIQGTLDDLRRLAGLVASAVRDAKPGEVIALGRAYVGVPSYELVLEVRSADFDPASADPELA
jgi:hypothetical protein